MNARFANTAFKAAVFGAAVVRAERRDEREDTCGADEDLRLGFRDNDTQGG